MITQENLLLHELIGLDAVVVQSNNRQIIGTAGMVVDETKSMFSLNTKNGIKKIPKENSDWQFSFEENKSIVNGRLLAKRPTERLGGKV